jgi:hypothetical protein
MVEIPLRNNSTILKIYESYEERQRKSPPRIHLGASEIGHECERKIWYSYRWVAEQVFNGRMLRLFDTGKLEENRLVADLNGIDGVDVKAFDLKTGRQFRLDLFGGHFGGSLDGLCIGIPEAPKTWHVLEMKTHNDKSFKSLVSKGVKESKPEHFIQMQAYMGMSHEQTIPLVGSPIERAFYFAVNKNTDDLYEERVHFEPIEYEKIKAKAKRVLFSNKPLPKISSDEDFYVCKMCHFKEICHSKEIKISSKRNCRTCLHSTAYDDGTWRCEKFNKVLGITEQREGCMNHLYIPGLVPLRQTDVLENDKGVIYESEELDTYINYEGGELRAYNK